MLDCIAGIAIGTGLWWAKVFYGATLESFVMSGSMWAPLLVLAVTIFLIRIHPEPADACCKCFEDGVAFAGVFVGVKFGQWRNPVLNSIGVGHQISLHEPVVILLFKISLQITLGSDPLILLPLISKGSLHSLGGEQLQSLFYTGFCHLSIVCLRRRDLTCLVVISSEPRKLFGPPC